MLLHIVLVAALLSLSTLQVVEGAGKPKSLRGIAPADLSYYQGKKISCRDGSKAIPIGKVNDDYCDCADGTDEPGTSACPSGKFYCRNKGHEPKVLFASRVNDGICDCCDGSDEYEGRITCQNRCKEEGAASRQQLADEVAMYTAGAKQREAEVARVKEKRANWEAEVKKLKAQQEELKAKEAKLLEAKTAIETAEREEREWQEKLRKQQEEQDKALNEAAAKTEVEVSKEETSASTRTVVAETEPLELEPEVPTPEETAPVEEVPFGEADGAPAEGTPEAPVPENEAAADDDNFEGLSKEEIGRRIASRWTGGGGGEQDIPPPDQVPAAKSEYLHEPFSEPGVEVPDTPLPSEDSEDDHYPEDELPPHMDDDDHDILEEDDLQYQHDSEEHQDVDEDDDDDDSADDNAVEPPQAVSSVSSWLARILQWPKDVCSKLVNIWGPPPPAVNKQEAEKVKKEYKEVVEEKGRKTTRLSIVETKLKTDYGPDGAFVTLEENCYKLTVNQYVYEVCPYKKAVQEEGHVHTRLGNWGGFDEKYTKMIFKDGDHCWNGPARSLTVTLKCGLKPELSTVAEPSRCEYTAILATPTVCYTDTAQELQRQLDEKLKELEGPHDEL